MIMGFSVRKRTKGKNSWLNLSASKKNGINVSYTQKVGDLTLNFSKKPRRTTYNLGNGVRWTSSNPAPKKTPRSKPIVVDSHSLPKQKIIPSNQTEKLPTYVWVVMFVMISVIVYSII